MIPNQHVSLFPPSCRQESGRGVVARRCHHRGQRQRWQRTDVAGEGQPRQRRRRPRGRGRAVGKAIVGVDFASEEKVCARYCAFVYFVYFVLDLVFTCVCWDHSCKLRCVHVGHFFSSSGASVHPLPSTPPHTTTSTSFVYFCVCVILHEDGMLTE